jgi:hypothetical protein
MYCVELSKTTSVSGPGAIFQVIKIWSCVTTHSVCKVCKVTNELNFRSGNNQYCWLLRVENNFLRHAGQRVHKKGCIDISLITVLRIHSTVQ